MGEGHVKHGHSRRGKRSRLNRIWLNMRSRCTNPKMTCYNRYGGRGISVCSEWDSFQAFHDWAMSHGYADDLTIERKDTDGNYCPDNCEWITRLENSKRSHVYGKLHGTRNLRVDAKIVSEIKTKYLNGVTQPQLCAEYGFHSSYLSGIITEKNWSEVEPRTNYKPRILTKLNAEQVREIRLRGANGERFCDLAKEFQVDPSTISVICSGKSRKTIA